MPSAKEYLFGSPDKIKQVATGTKEQQQLGQNLIQQAMNMQQGGGYDLANQYFNQLLQPGAQGFEQFASPYMQQFQEQVLPGIAERFGGMGALSSSGFGQALGGAASGLQAQLAQLFSNLQNQAAQQQYGQFNTMTGQGLSYKPFENIKMQGSGGLLNTAMSGFMQGLGGSFNPMSMMSGIQGLFKPGVQQMGASGIRPVGMG